MQPGDTVQYHSPPIPGVVAWCDGQAIGIDCDGFTWTGTLEQFASEWTARKLLEIGEHA